jgi:hypothetical protein
LFTGLDLVGKGDFSDHFKFQGNTIAKGCYGQIIRVIYRETSESYVCKLIKYRTTKAQQEKYGIKIRKEAAAASVLRGHPSIMKVYGAYDLKSELAS